MAQITTIQPLDFLKNSRSIINQNFSNLNVALTALSANVGSVGSASVSALSAAINTLTLQVSALSANGTGTSYPVRNIEITSYIAPQGLDDTVNIRGANIFLGTLTPLLNGTITLSANNGYIQHVSDGVGTQLIDSMQGTQYGGDWLSFYRTNSLNGLNILNGDAYTVKDLPYLAVAGPLSGHANPIDALVIKGNSSDTSLYLISDAGNPVNNPGIYIPSVNNAALGRKLELNGPGVVAKEITIGGQLRFNPDNFDGYFTDNSTNFNIKTDSTTVTLSAAGSGGIDVYGDKVLIGTTHPLLNGNITLSANNGYVQVVSDGPGTQLIDNCQNTIYGGDWLTFYRTNSLSALNGSAYNLKNLPHLATSGPWLNTTTAIDALILNGNSSDTSIYITSQFGDPATTPSIYLPSLNNATLGRKLELNGPGVVAKALTIGGQPRFNPDNFDGYYTDGAANLNITTDSSTVYLNADGPGGIKMIGSDIFIGTSNPLDNGNITLSANNGYVQVITDGPGTQLIDDLQGASVGGNWLEFYRTNAASGILVGTAYEIVDVPNLLPAGPFISLNKIDALSIYGSNNDASIYLAANLGDSYTNPSIYIPSVNNAALGSKITLNGAGVLAQELTVGGQTVFDPNNYDGYYTGANSNFNVKTDPTYASLSAAGTGGMRLYGDSVFIGTTHPLQNGNITLSANNGYTIIESDGPGLQIKDNLHGTTVGGNWIEFYRTQASGSVFNGTAYIIKDTATFTSAGIDALSLLGTTNDSNIYIASNLDYGDTTPGILVNSTNNVNLSGTGVHILGSNGLVTRNLVVGNTPSTGTVPPSANVNFEVSYNDYTGTVYLSGLESSTTLQIGAVSAIYFANGTIIGPSAPAHSYGASGDKAGTIAFDSNFIYYCTANYINNSTDIWRRVALSATSW